MHSIASTRLGHMAGFGANAMKLRSTLTVILAALMMSEGAFALSCMKPDLVKTLEEAKASDKVYHILAGKFVSEPTEDHDRGGYKLGPSSSDGSRAVTLPQGNKTPKIT